MLLLARKHLVPPLEGNGLAPPLGEGFPKFDFLRFHYDLNVAVPCVYVNTFFTYSNRLQKKESSDEGY